ncbi:uncharacterized protein F5Z01DRAFT_51526 [Emericellopsis atlantica]|uniref:Uncharacterized protein n=1 Tax=Emericellopsis atlantica TaxID=2614577 RepID=A0A9P8CQ93_9HYPO|nr:uncharacterized protein F5Z01DRAFT_51526 [Emericellopsis atlantica]KAG9255388.1 hypothetical protein F5Z01DRAFT_51526 [Emericellopsis atlantica]
MEEDTLPTSQSRRDASLKSKADIEGILNKLENPADASNSTELDKLLVQLHGATRTLGEGALEPLFSKRGVRIIGGYAFQAHPKPEHLPALRCLNNILVRSPESRKLLPTEIGTDRIISALKVCAGSKPAQFRTQLKADSAMTPKTSWLWPTSSSSRAMAQAWT